MVFPVLKQKLEINEPFYHTGSTSVHIIHQQVNPREEILIVDENHKVFRKPILIMAEQVNKNLWITKSHNILTHGSGNNLEDAMEDFLSMLLDYYFELESSEELLSNQLYEELQYLRKIIIADLI